MLRELRVRNLGVIEDVAVVLGPGMTALTGETGAGKTLIVEAIDLLLGGRADPVLVRPGAAEAIVEGRFDRPGDAEPSEAPQPPDADAEVVLTRVVPATGRSRAYIDGRMAPLSALAATGRGLVDLHGQHASQALLSPGVQRASLDRAGGIDLGPLATARRRLAGIEAELAALGGDDRSRAREADLLRFQLAELAAAGVEDPDEDAALEDEQQRLTGVLEHRSAAETVHEAILGDGGALDAVGTAVAAAASRPPLAGLAATLRDLQAQLAEAGSDARRLAEGFEDDPDRLAEVAARRQVLRDLRRKYGDTLAEVIAFAEQCSARLAELDGWETRAAALDAERLAALDEVDRAGTRLAAARRRAAAPLAAAVEAALRTLAMPRARFSVEVQGPTGDEVTWLLAANPGQPALPLAKVASGGELARTMLAARLALGGAAEGTPTLVFDEVDAGIGGEAAVAVGRALASLAATHQVLVVTHLPQVAAFADAHLAVAKTEAGGSTSAGVTVLDGSARVVELSRMLSGRPGSDTARRHAEELLATARGDAVGHPA